MLTLSGTTGVPVDALPFLVGQVCFFAMPTAPTGFLFCNGQEISRSTYAALFTAIGTLYGSGNGSTTFNLPDLRGEFIRGWDAGRGVDSGRAFGTWQKGSIVAGEDLAPGNSVNVPEYAGNYALWGLDNPNASWSSGLTGSVASRASGYDVSADPNYRLHTGVTRPRNVALYPCIFARV